MKHPPVRLCGVYYDAPQPDVPATAKERHRLERRLIRLERRTLAARGPTMNLAWLHWNGEWCKVWAALGCPGAD